MKIYTKTGDGGETGLFAGPRVAKDHARIEAYGTVDELNAVLGWAWQELQSTAIRDLVTRVQNELFSVGAELATPDPTRHGTALIGERHVRRLEEEIDAFEATLAPLKQFILPGGSRGAAALHVARAVCRRAERRVVTLFAEAGTEAASSVLVYLNRLSDLLFVVARAENAAQGQPDVPWHS